MNHQADFQSLTRANCKVSIIISTDYLPELQMEIENLQKQGQFEQELVEQYIFTFLFSRQKSLKLQNLSV